MPNGYPEITHVPELRSVEKERNIVMECAANGSPEPTISWLKDFKPLDLSDPRLSIILEGIGSGLCCNTFRLY